MPIEPHIQACVDKIPESELRLLVGQMLQRLVQLDGPALVGQMFAPIGKAWCDPPQWRPE
jgi:hypothetical protein